MRKLKLFLLVLPILQINIAAQSWEFVGLDSLLIKQIYVSGDTIWAGTDVRINKNMNAGIYKSTDGGKNWGQLDSTLGDGTSVCFYKNSGGNLLYVVKGTTKWSLAGTLYRSIDRGENWEIAPALPDKYIKWFMISPFNKDEMYALDNGYVKFLYRSTDGGENWQQIDLFPSSSHGNRVTVALDQLDGSKLYAAVDDRIGGNYFYIGTNKGDTWNYISEPPTVQQELISDPTVPNKVFMMPGYYLTEDDGYSWLIADSCFPNNYSYLSFYVDPFNETNFYSLRLDGLYKTKNDTICWQLIEGSDNLPLNIGSYGFIYEDIGQLRNIFIDSLTKKIYVGTAKGIYRKDITTDISEPNNDILSGYILFQNYPNPFNPITTVKYSIPERSNVTVKVYDVLGKEISTLVSEETKEGEYEVKFDGTKLTSGVYFYVLTATAKNGKRYKQGRKMILLK